MLEHKGKLFKYIIYQKANYEFFNTGERQYFTDAQFLMHFQIVTKIGNFYTAALWFTADCKVELMNDIGNKNKANHLQIILSIIIKL